MVKRIIGLNDFLDKRSLVPFLRLHVCFKYSLFFGFDVVIVIIMVIIVVVILTLKSVDEIIRCYYSNETCLSELLRRTIPDTSIFRILQKEI